jgi:thioredoxin 1
MEITAKQLKQKIENGDKVIVDFWGNFCGPCKIMKPTFEKVSKEIMNENIGVEMVTLDVQTYQEYAMELGIKAVPTIKSFANGVEISSKLGIQSESQLKEMAKTLING